ncbi:hypothetical protein ACN2MM_00965 [Alkalilimnicola ehrlichii MLHE-1]|uniref:Uncharacterized protein n=1 Tax=Alkalilimnicola ehrlichii (strain ATCC BAA-1101 / DSM 17681 / MLHE-1) TaxID=187272 RepID=Q0ACI1_ALKEH|nr:hypothetical protein [Alkalilimnicola ehrlichii]ABI55456.1 hypothetical protein Mlg_0099 [Alkalilimnicola ehrlichii MLHE-1]
MREWIRQYVERIVMDAISEEVYQELDPGTLSEISVQVSLFVTNILLSVAGGLVVAVVAYALVSRHQAKSAQVTREIERQRLLHDLEADHSRISSEASVWFPEGRERFHGNRAYSFVVAMTREVCWLAPDTIRYDWSRGKRHVAVSEDGVLVDSATLHEALFWFRRLHRAFRAGLLYRSDLYDLWRQILPFTTDRRYDFLVAYFGGQARRGDEDVLAVRAVATEVIRYCQSKGKQVPLDYLSGRVDDAFVQSLPRKLMAHFST